MSAQVNMEFIKGLRKRDKMWGLLSIKSLLCNQFTKFNNAGAQILDSVYHMTFKLR